MLVRLLGWPVVPNSTVTFRCGTETSTITIAAELASQGIPWPPTGLPSPTGPAFTIMLRGTENNVAVDWWEADYYRTLPYTANTGWSDGNRSGYRGAYMFLMWNDVPVGRTTFHRVEGADYAIVNDRNMIEHYRHYDGTLGTPQNPVPEQSTPFPTEPYVPDTGPDQRPVIGFLSAADEILEVRNYENIVAGGGIKFRQVNATEQRVTVIAYKDNNPALVVYYDSIVPGVKMVSNF